MKKFLVFVVVLLAGVNAGLIYEIFGTEYRAITWERRVNSAEVLEEQKCDALRSIEYGQDCLGVARMLATENGLLCERDAKLTLYVAGVEEENMRLKAVVADGVDRMESMLQENNQLHEELDRTYYRIQCLEKALEFMPTPATEEDLDDIKDDVLEIFETAKTVIDVVTVLPFLL